MDDISHEDYELAVLSKARIDFSGESMRVEGTENGIKHYVVGRYSLAARQLDVAIYRDGEERPFIIADAKRHGRRITVKDVEAFIGMVDDIGVETSLLIASDGFTRAAARRAAAASMHVFMITRDEALTYRWLPIAREIYPQDEGSHEELAEVKRLFYEHASPDAIVEALEGIPFDELIACVKHMLEKHHDQGVEFLLAVAHYHIDDGWRFNAIQQLIEANRLDTKERQDLLVNEADPEIIGLLL